MIKTPTRRPDLREMVGRTVRRMKAVERQNAILAIWVAAAAVLIPFAIVMVDQDVWGTLGLIGLMALVFPGVPFLAIAFEKFGSKR